jgi:hypothetical protein
LRCIPQGAKTPFQTKSRLPGNPERGGNARCLCAVSSRVKGYLGMLMRLEGLVGKGFGVAVLRYRYVGYLGTALFEELRMPDRS